MDVADYLVAFLAAKGVRHVFGYPGGALVPLLGAIERHPQIEWVLMRHENAAAFAACAQAKLNGRLAVCAATAGPGALNFLCGVVDAHLDRAPVLTLTGQVPSSQKGHVGFQDLDQASLFRTILRRSESTSNPIQLASLLRNLIGHAEQHRETVHLAVPVDLLRTELDKADDLYHLDPEQLPHAPPLMPPPPAAVDKVARTLEEFGQVVMVLGNRAVGCGAAVERLAEKLGAPILTTLDGKGIADESHPNVLGVFGMWGQPGIEVTKKLISRSDAVLAFGVDVPRPFLVDSRDVQRRALIQCEPDFTSLTHDYHRSRTLVGPLDIIATELCERLRADHPRFDMRILAEQRNNFIAGITELARARSDSRFGNPIEFLVNLGNRLDAASTVILDSGAHALWGAQFLRLTARQRVLVSARLGTMGFALPAAIGTQLARPRGRAVALCGDGCFQMVMGELATAVQQRLPIIVVVFENGILQNVAAQKATAYGTILHNPDHVALAHAFGAAGAVVDGTTDIASVLDVAFSQTDRPFLIDLRCDPEVMAPLATWDVPGSVGT